MACASEPAGKLEQSVLRDHLNCPICLETYRSPRALYCMHTYCEECIDSVIVKNADQWLVKMAQMGTLQDELGDSAQSLESNVTQLDNQSVAIKEKIEDTRNTLIQQVNKLMDRLSSDCDQLRKENSIKLEDEIFQKKSQLAALTSSCSVLRSTLERGSDAQAFIAYHKIQQQVRQCQARFQQDRDGAATLQLVLDLDNVPDIWRLCERKIGNVSVYTTKGEAVSETDSKRIPLAQCEVEILPIVDIQKRPEDTKQPWYRGIVYLPNGQLAAIDGNNKTCCLLDGAYKATSEMQLKTIPRSIALIGASEVAMVLKNQKDIQVIELGRNMILFRRSISCSRIPRHVAVISDRELAVGWETGFGIIQQTGEEISFISRDTAGRQIKFETNDFMAVDVKRSRVYQTCDKENSVHAFGFTGEPHFTYKNNSLKQPNGIALDRDLNVCICSRGTGTIHQLYPDGSLLRVIDTGLTRPYSLCFKPTRECVVVFNSNHGSYQVFAARFV